MKRARWGSMAAILIALGCQCASPSSERAASSVEPNVPRARVETGLSFPLDPPSPTPLEARPVFEAFRFERPVFLTAAPGQEDRIYVVEQPGRIVSFAREPAVAEVDVFLDLKDRVRTVHNEEGLLGLAFAPDFEASGVFYIFYSASKPRRTVLSRFRTTDDRLRALPESEEVLLEFEQPYGNHNGGMIAFGPEGHLYVGLGDGGAAGDPLDAGQDLSRHLGSILRLDVSSSDSGYRVPVDNPFVDRKEARPEIWAYGLRNPWRFSFDRATGELWVGDVGQDRFEEIDVVQRGGNYGWRRMEASASFAQSRTSATEPTIEPIAEYGHDAGESVTGGYVYRGTRLPSFRGAYLYGDYVSGTVWALTRSGETVNSRVVARVPSLSSFGEDAQGELYALDHGSGRILQFVSSGGGGDDDAFPTRLSETGVFVDTARLEPNPSLVPYDVAVPLWSDGATKRRWLALPEGRPIEFAPEGSWGFPVGTVFVKHFELPVDEREPERTVRLETRVMVHERTGWAGYTYRWNDAQSDAELVTSPQRAAYPVYRDGREARQSWYFPAGSDCMRCHTTSYGPVLGARTRQLATRDSDGGPSVLERWAALGLFERELPPIEELSAHPRWEDEAAPIDARARAYLDANCAVCHHVGGPAPGGMDLRAQTPLEQTRLVDVPVEQHTGGSATLRLKPGSPRSSALWERMSSRSGEVSMPPLATSVVDEDAITLIAAWIESLGPASAL